ncbi:MAG: hypothetical protein ABH868_04650 [bacterium]
MKKQVLSLIILVYLLIMCVFSNRLWAEDVFEYQTTQMLGMGGVQMGTTHDGGSFLHNPGALAYLSRPRISVGLLSLGWNNEILDFYQLSRESEMQDILKGDKDWEDASSDLRNKMFVHRIAMLKANSNINVMVPLGPLGSVGGGIYIDGKATSETDRGVYVPTALINYQRDFALVVSYARKQEMPFGEDILEPFAFGINIRYLQRQKMRDFRTLVEFETFSFSNMVTKGWGLGVDFGMAYRMLQDRLGFALVWKDIGDTKMKWDNNDTTQICTRANFGVTYKPTKVYLWKAKFIPVGDVLELALDINELGRYVDFYKRLHVGARVHFLMFSASAGLNQGYPALGAGLKLGLTRIEYAYYGAERGVFAGQDLDWRHSIALSAAF